MILKVRTLFKVARKIYRNLGEVFSVANVQLYTINIREGGYLASHTPHLFYAWKLADECLQTEVAKDLELSSSFSPIWQVLVATKQVDMLVCRNVASDELVGYLFYNRINKRISAYCLFNLESSECFLGPAYIKSAHRRKGLMTLGYLHASRHAQSDQRQFAFTDVSARNNAQLNVVRKAGMSVTNSGYYVVRLLRRTYIFPYGFFKTRFYYPRKLIATLSI